MNEVRPEDPKFGAWGQNRPQIWSQDQKSKNVMNFIYGSSLPLSVGDGVEVEPSSLLLVPHHGVDGRLDLVPDVPKLTIKLAILISS